MSLYKNGLFIYPGYLAVIPLIYTNNDRFNLTRDVGIDSNFMQARNLLTSILNTHTQYLCECANDFYPQLKNRIRG
jgi:hypothetical protein